MSYIRYKKLRKYVDGIPTNEYRKSSDRYDFVEYESYEDCMKGVMPVMPEDNGQFSGNEIEKHPFYRYYFTIEALEEGRFKINENSTIYDGMYFSLNDSEWSGIGNKTLTMKAGDKLRLKKKASGIYYDSNSAPITTIFYYMPKCKIYGNINSMYAGDDFLTDLTTYPSRTVMDANPSMFYYWFYGHEVVDASGLVLPYMTLRGSMYSGMFNYCTLLEKAPVLPATDLNSRCYSDMFRSCSSLEKAPVLHADATSYHCYEDMFYQCRKLNYIKCLFSKGIVYDTSSSLSWSNTNTYLWVTGVPSEGTFVKKSGTEWSVGVCGIPEGWTVEEVDE